LEDEFFEDDEEEIFLTSELMIKKFQEWWTKDEIVELLQDEKIVDPIFLDNIQINVDDDSELDHLEFAKILFDQLGEKFIFGTEEEGKLKKFRILGRILKVIVTKQPSLEKEFHKIIQEHFEIPSTQIPKIGQSEDEHGWLPIEDWLWGLPRWNTKTKFIAELVEFCGLPDTCAQKEKTEKDDRKSEIVDPIGVMNSLYDFQIDVSYQIKKLLEDDHNYETRGMVALPTGSGKTRIVVETIIDWINNGKKGQPDKKFILWIVDKNELCQQAFDAFKEIFIAKGKRDTSLNLQIFWGKKGKNLTDTLVEGLSEAQNNTTSIIVASQPSLSSIVRNTEDNLKLKFVKKKYDPERDYNSKEINYLWRQMGKPEINMDGTSIRNLGNTCAVTVIDEAHHAIADSYSQVLRGLGFEFAKTQTHPKNCRLLGLTATPFRRETEISGTKSWKCEDCDLKFTHETEKNYHKEKNHDHKIITISAVQTESERLRNRFGKKFFWPSLDAASLTDEANYPRPIIELQQTATLGRPIRISGERSYDQDGQIKEYYWQIKINRDVAEYSKDPYKYDTGKKFGCENSPEENFEDWQKGKWHSTDEKSVINAENDIFDQVGEYQVFLWVKDDEGLVSIKEDIRLIKISKPVETTTLEDQETLRDLYDKLIKREVLANPERWEVQHDSQSWLDANGWEAEYAINPLTGEKNVEKLDHLTLNRIGQEPRFNEKIVAVVKKLIDDGKESILLFGLTVDHARLLTDLIRIKLKIKTAFIWYKTHTDERCKFIKEFRAKKIQVLCNDSILTTGFDAPQIDAIVNAKYTKSYVLYTQMIGRGLRGPKNGGTKECTIVDFNANLKSQVEGLSAEEKLEAWRFHDELLGEPRKLTNEDLGLKPDDVVIQEQEERAEAAYQERLRLEEIENQKRRAEEKVRKELEEKARIKRDNQEKARKWIESKFSKFQKNDMKMRSDEWRNLHILFSRFPEFQEKSIWEKFWSVIKEKESTKESRQNRRFDIEEDIELTNSNQKLSFNDLMYFITDEMKLMANYQPVMMKYLLSCNEYTANRYDISKKIKSYNPNKGNINFENIPVYDVLIKHNVVKMREGVSGKRTESFDEYKKRLDTFQNHTKSDDVFVLNINTLNPQLTEMMNRELDYQIDLYAKRQGGKFTHICPKCKIVSVDYHKPPKQHEKEEMEEKFGFRGEQIQSWCRDCRSKERNK